METRADNSIVNPAFDAGTIRQDPGREDSPGIPSPADRTPVQESAPTDVRTASNPTARPNMACCATSGKFVAAIDAGAGGKLTVRHVGHWHAVWGVPLEILNEKIEKHAACWTCCAMSGDLLVAGNNGKTGGQDGKQASLVVWNLKTGDEDHLETGGGAIRCCAIYTKPSSNRDFPEDFPVVSNFSFIVAGSGKTLHKHAQKSSGDPWKPQPSQVEPRSENPAHADSSDLHVTCCAIAGNMIAVGVANRLIVTHTTCVDVVHTFNHTGNVTCCAVSVKLERRESFRGDLGRGESAIKYIAAGDDDKELVVWDLDESRKSKTDIAYHKFWHGGELTCCAISDDPDCDQLIAGDAAKRLTVRGLRNGEIRYSFEHKALITCCAISGSPPKQSTEAGRSLSLIAATAQELTVRKGDMVPVELPGLPETFKRYCLEYPREATMSSSDPPTVSSSPAEQQPSEQMRQTSQPVSRVLSKISLFEGVCDQPHLLHCRGELFGNNKRQTTLLHVLADANEKYFPTACLEVILDAVKTPTAMTGPDNRDDVPFVLVPCYDSNGNTPLDAALNVGNDEKAELLAQAYVDSADRAAKRIGEMLENNRRLYFRQLQHYYTKHNIRDKSRADIMKDAEKCSRRKGSGWLDEQLAKEHGQSLTSFLAASHDDSRPVSVYELCAKPKTEEELYRGQLEAYYTFGTMFLREPRSPKNNRKNNRTEHAPREKLLRTAYGVLEIPQRLTMKCVDRGGSGWLDEQLVKEHGQSLTGFLAASSYTKHVPGDGSCRSQESALWPWAHTGIARWIKQLVLVNPARLRFLLDAATLERPSPRNFPTVAQSHLPKFIPCSEYQDVNLDQDGNSDKWRAEFGAELGGMKHGRYCNWRSRIWRQIRHWFTKDQKPTYDLDVTEKVIGTYGLLAIDGPFDAIALSCSSKTFETEAMVWAVEFKWQAYGWYIHAFLMYSFVFGLALFWVAQIAAIVDHFDVRVLGAGQVHLNSSPDRGGAFSQVANDAMTMSMYQIGALLIAEIVQLAGMNGNWKHRVIQYVSDGWNWLEVTTYCTMLAGASTFSTLIEREQHVRSTALCGVANVLATLNLLAFLRTSDSVGQNIRMLIRITKDIWPFLVVQLIFILGFTMAFAVLLPDQPRFQLPMALLTSYDMMLGAWDLEQFEGSLDDRDNWVLTMTAVVMFVLYTLAVLVVAMK